MDTIVTVIKTSQTALPPNHTYVKLVRPSTFIHNIRTYSYVWIKFVKPRYPEGNPL